ncbi:uncharacterized protein LOC123723446 isoform X1 [Papilio machaon]|uniref:uncharacterized protein LOC123723446 isoform X1 n=1 Tax=Papilio machaon TaxID=76193 RepID=UPI001E663106|nr:uncharacterized protein LOC123723446 isoform X1 [Papilio machaon]
MDCRTVLFLTAILLSILAANVEGRTKKVVIHVPVKTNKLKHTHTVYRTVHHHHTHHNLPDHGSFPVEEHEHFHHYDPPEPEPALSHNEPLNTLGLNGFLPDAPLDVHDFINLENKPLKIPFNPRYVHRGVPYRPGFLMEIN